MDAEDIDLLDQAFDSQLAVEDTDSVDEQTVELDEELGAAAEPAAVSTGSPPVLTPTTDNIQGHVPAEHSSDNDSENEDEFLDEPSNHELRPFRDNQELTSAHVMRNRERGRNADSICSASTTTSVAPEVIRERVKKQFKSQEKIRQARRIRKHGEAAIQTKARRENRYDVETSLDAGWY